MDPLTALVSIVTIIVFGLVEITDIKTQPKQRRNQEKHGKVKEADYREIENKQPKKELPSMEHENYTKKIILEKK